MGVAANILQSARETAESITPSAEQIRATATDTIRGAYQSIRGSGHLMTELKNTADAFVGMPAEALGGVLKATGRLLTLQPIEATRALAQGMVGTCRNLAKFTTSPVPMVLAAAENSVSATKKAVGTVAGLPKTAFLKGYGVVERGVNHVLDLFGSDESVKSKVPDLGGAAVPPPSAPQAV